MQLEELLMATLAIPTYTSCLTPNEASQNIKITFQTNKEKTN